MEVRAICDDGFFLSWRPSTELEIIVTLSRFGLPHSHSYTVQSPLTKNRGNSRKYSSTLSSQVRLSLLVFPYKPRFKSSVLALKSISTTDSPAIIGLVWIEDIETVTLGWRRKSMTGRVRRTRSTGISSEVSLRLPFVVVVWVLYAMSRCTGYFQILFCPFCFLYPYHQLDMASRRLAISSLLCSDEGNPSSPSPTSSPTSARTSTARDFEPVDRLSRHHPAFSAQTSGVHTRTAPTHHPLSDAKHTPAVDRLRSYNDNDVLRYLPTTYPPQLGHGREPSASPEHLPTQHQQTYPMSPYNAQSSPQPNPWSGHSPLYPRSSTSSSQDHCFPLTQSPVESKSRSFSNSSTHLTHYPPQSTSTFSPFNPSTVSPQPPPSLGGGLEALAQAASQERRRLSNEIAESMRSASRESSTRITTVVQHPVASPSTSEHRVREPAPTWRRRSKHHPEPPHKRRKSYDLLDEPIPAEPLEIFQPNRPPMDRNSLMRISTLVPDLPPLDRIYTPQKSQRSPTLPRISDIRHGVGTGPTIPIANLLTNDSPPRRITSPPHPRPPLPLQTTPSPVAQKAPTSPLSRSPTTPQRSPFLVDDLQKLPSELREPYRSPSTPVVPIPNHPVIGHIFSKVRSPPSTVEELVEGAEQVHNVPISPTPVQESSEPPTPSPVIPVEMHPSLSPSSIEDQPPTPVRLASSVAEFEPEPVPTLESPVPQLSTAVTKTEPEPEQASEPPSVLDPPSAPDVEKEQVASPNIEPPRQISIISISTPLPPPPYASHVLPMPGPGVRPPSPIPTPDYPESRHSLVQPELEHNLDPEARNDDEGTESDNMTVDIEFDLATNVADDNTIEGMRTDSEYNIEMDVDDDPLRLVNGDVTGTGPKDDDGGRVGASRYKNNAQGTNTLDARFDHAVPPPMDLEKIMREQGQPRILYQQLQGPGQPLVPLIVHEPPPEPKPEPKPTTKGKKKQPTKVGNSGVSSFLWTMTESLQPPARPKQPAKIRAKGNTKVKVDTLQAQSALETVSYTGSGRMTKAPAVLSLPVTNLNSSAVGAAAARSRSQSTMPVAGENLDDKQVEKDEMDDKVYCICRAEYEEGKVMIACDRFVNFTTPRPHTIDTHRFRLSDAMNGTTCSVWACLTWMSTSSINSFVFHASRVS